MERSLKAQVQAIREQQCQGCRDVGYVMCACRKAKADSRGCHDCKGAEVVPCLKCPKGREIADRHFAILVKPEGNFEVIEGWCV